MWHLADVILFLSHMEVEQFQIFLETGKPLFWGGHVPLYIIYLEENLPVLTRLQTGT